MKLVMHVLMNVLKNLMLQRFVADGWPAQWRGHIRKLHGAASVTQSWVLAGVPALMLAAVLTACGPGTGGTGVGPVTGTYVSAATTAGSPAVPSTAPSTIASASYVLVLEPLGIRLTGACLAFQFDGAWVDANGEIRVTGSYRQAAPASDLALATDLPGTLVAKVQTTALTVTLQDARGAVVLSFATGAKLADGAAAVTAPACKSLPAVAAP